MQTLARTKYQGASLIESLVSIFILGFVSLGMTEFTRVVASEHRETTLRNLALYQVKNAIQNNNSESFQDTEKAIILPMAEEQAGDSNFEINMATALRNGSVGETELRQVNMPKSAAVEIEPLKDQLVLGLDMQAKASPEEQE